MIKAAMAILLLSALDMFAQTSQSKGAGAAPVPQWRRDAVKFREELTRYQKTATGDKKFPNTSFNFMGGGGVVPREWEVMQLYGGEVEWEGTFEGFEEKGNLKPRNGSWTVKSAPK